MATLNTNLQGHLDGKGYAYTITANGVATIQSSLNDYQVEELHRIAGLNNHDLKLVAGVPTLNRR